MKTLENTMRLLLILLLGALATAAETTSDPALETAKATYAKEKDSIQAKADQDLEKAKAKLDAAYQAAIKRAMAKGDLPSAKQLSAEMEGGPVASGDTPRNDEKSKAIDVKAKMEERNAFLDMAKTEANPEKKLGLLLMANDVLFAIGDQNGYAKENAALTSKYGGDPHGTTSARIILRRMKNLQGAMPPIDAKQAWNRAFSDLEKVAKPIFDTYHGVNNDGCCTAAETLAKQLDDAGDKGRAAVYQEKLLEYGGTNFDPAGRACLWLADYWLEQKNKAKAKVYLVWAKDKYQGTNRGIAKEAEKRLDEFETAK